MGTMDNKILMYARDALLVCNATDEAVRRLDRILDIVGISHTPEQVVYAINDAIGDARILKAIRNKEI